MRCNVGVNPKLLLDQHLIAEYRELPMVVGSLRGNNWEVKGAIPNAFRLGKGHINFFKNKLLYLAARHVLIKRECFRRKFACNGLVIDLQDAPTEFLNMWWPSLQDTFIIRGRIIERIVSANRKRPGWWKYWGKNLVGNQLQKFMKELIESEVCEI